MLRPSTARFLEIFRRRYEVLTLVVDEHHGLVDLWLEGKRAGVAFRYETHFSAQFVQEALLLETTARFLLESVEKGLAAATPAPMIGPAG